MLKAFYNEEQLAVDGDIYRLVLNFRAIDATESLIGCSFNSILRQITLDPPLGLVGKLLWGLLREHHPEVSLDEAASLMFGDTGVLVGAAVRRLLDAAFPQADEGDGKPKDGNPPKRRGQSETS